MAVWQILKAGSPTKAELFDDGDLAVPGDEAFSTDAIRAHVQSLGKNADGFNYVGPTTPPPAPAEPPAEDPPAEDISGD
jgi:hypothetical protein